MQGRGHGGGATHFIAVSDISSATEPPRSTAVYLLHFDPAEFEAEILIRDCSATTLDDLTRTPVLAKAKLAVLSVLTSADPSTEGQETRDELAARC